MRNPFDLADAASGFLDCACVGLVDHGLLDVSCCGPDGVAFVAQGSDVAWDTCCDPCGSLSIRLVRIFETVTPPTQIVAPSKCGHRRLAAEFEILRTRCVTVSENAEAQPPILPLPSTMTAEGRAILADLRTIWTSIECCLTAVEDDPYRDEIGWMIDGALSGPQGGCVGAVVRFGVTVGPSCDCREFTPPPIG